MNPETKLNQISIFLKIGILSFFIFGFLFILDSSYAVYSAEVIAPLTNDSPPEVTAHGSLKQDIAVLPPQSGLSAEAKETYAYLLLIQAIYDEDEAAMLEAATLMGEIDAQPGIWLDGGLWLTSRKSPNAIVFLEKALKAHPEDISLNLLYAEALGEHGMASQGVQKMREFMQRHPDSLDARIELALLLVKDKKFDDAQKILNSISTKQRNYLVDYYQAKALMGMDKFSEAIPLMRKAVKGMPEFTEGLLDLALLYEKVGNLRDARITYEKLQKLQFSPQEIGLRLVNLSLKLKQPDRALQYIKQGPNTLQFKISAAHMLVESRHFLQAENILKQIVADQPAHGMQSTPVEVYLLLADLVYEQRHNLGMALSWLDKIPEKDKNNPKVFLLRIQLTAEAGKLDDALSLANSAVEKFPQSSELTDFRIRLLAKDHKNAEAIEAARQALTKWPNNGTLAFILGSLLDETGDKKAALSVMEDLLKKEPENYQVMNYIGFTLADENRDLERALELLKKAVELAPNEAFIIDSLAWAYFRLGKYEDALREIRRAIKLGETTDSAIWDHYGDIAQKSAKKEEARKAYRKAIDLKPKNTDEIREKLNKL